MMKFWNLCVKKKIEIY